MRLKRLEISGFKSFAKKSVFEFNSAISAIVGPNGSGKSNVAEAIRFVLGEQSMKSLRGKRGEDLVWSGSNTAGRSNVASVTLVFDNSNRTFDIDYDEVSVRRDVHRDGSNQYFINGSQVRLRDVIELLSQVHIGASSHHIISQGEADRILNTNTKERRSMIEDALGLKVYHWKIDESEKKLKKTEENIKEVESLRREITPHLKFLKKQVERIEKTREMREKLKQLYAEYLKREEIYITKERTRVVGELQGPEKQLEQITDELTRAREELNKTKHADPKTKELAEIERQLSEARHEKNEYTKEASRIEGMIEYEQRRRTKLQEKQEADKVVPLSKLRAFVDEFEQTISHEAPPENEEAFRSFIARMRERVRSFFDTVRDASGTQEEAFDGEELQELEQKHKTCSEQLQAASQKEKNLQDNYNTLQKEIESQKDDSRALERSVYEMMAQKSELASEVEKLRAQKTYIEKAKDAFNEELKEGSALIGRDVLSYEQFTVDEQQVLSEPREEQEKRRKEIEKIKIKLEEEGMGNSDEVIKEYEDTTERDAFLANEIADLQHSAESLRALIADLTEKLDTEFKEGVGKINTQFQEFFSLMFGGGQAKLVVVAQKKKKQSDTDALLADGPSEEEEEEGVDIAVSLPRKKIKGLQMLSGGERALTSIALIFAVSQVNPPPFLVLDETDAALDEANSRRYGDMLENLSQFSQLIVITHNRETMSHAGVLYGVTMGSDAVSKLLSVKFDEAATYAK